MTQKDLIEVVRKHQPIHANEIARKMGKNLSEIATPLSRLLNKGILTRESTSGFETIRGKRTVSLYRIKP